METTYKPCTLRLTASMEKRIFAENTESVNAGQEAVSELLSRIKVVVDKGQEQFGFLPGLHDIIKLSENEEYGVAGAALVASGEELALYITIEDIPAAAFEDDEEEPA